MGPNNRNKLENDIAKNHILSTNNTFKTAFKATLGYYAGRFVAGLIEIVLILTVLGIVGLAVAVLNK